MKVVFFETMPGEEEFFRAALSSDIEPEFHTETLCSETAGLAQGAAAVSVFVKSAMTADLLEQLPDLKLVATRSMGYDHIDVGAAKARGVKVANVTTYAAHPVAEFTFALLLAVARRIYPAYEQVREGTDWENTHLTGVTLHGKTIGIVGTGRIGSQVARIARGFGMEVLACDARPNEQLAQEVGFRYVELDELLANADIVTLHVPVLPETEHLMNKEAFGKMKKGAILINTARGEIVDTKALVAALQDGTLRGAGLDVLEAERQLAEERKAIAEGRDLPYGTLAADHTLIDMPNVVVTPHAAYNTEEALQEIMRVTAQSITDWAAGKEQKYV